MTGNGIGTEMERTVGIDQLGVYVPRYVLPLEELAVARNVPVEKILVGIGAHKMAVAPPWEDAVTLAANATARLFARALVDPNEIGFVLVATETAVDHAKPASIFLHELLGLRPNCRTFELKHACYSGTAGVMMAADWIRSGAARGRKALVVATDIARYPLGSAAEFTQGSGAVAVLVSEQPRLLALDRVSGVFARNVYDFWRPLQNREALVDGEFSLNCYLDALDGALADYHTNANGSGRNPLTDRFAAFLYHTPFPKMAYKAHMRLFEHDWRRMGKDPASSASEAKDSYATHVEPSLAAARMVGNTYTASLYFCLASLAEQAGTSLEEREAALFSYGSGCCSEFFTGRFSRGAGDAASHIGLASLLGARRELTVENYEEFARDAPEGGIPPSDDTAFCHLSGVREQKRIYERCRLSC